MISIITPVYNAANYIRKCIESIICQSYQDWELILIDDESIDDSGKICDAYAEQDNRIRVIHQRWGGVSSARNAGLCAARGQWVTFVDADDFLASDFLRHLKKRSNEDFVISGYISYPEQNVNKIAENDCSVNLSDVGFANGQYLFMFYFPWAKLYKTDIIKENHLTFCEDIRLSEDSCFIIRYMAHCKTVGMTILTDYYYRSQTASSKYVLTYSELVAHNAELKKSINYFECLKGVNLLFLHKHLATIFFFCYKDFLYASNYHKYRINVRSWTKCKWKSFCVMLDVAMHKRLLYEFLVTYPTLGFCLSRVLKLLQKQK